MLAVYGKDEAACDEMTEAAFAGYHQNLPFVQEQQGAALASVMLKMFAAARGGL